MKKWQYLTEILESTTLTNELDFIAKYYDSEGTEHNFTILTTDFIKQFTGDTQYSRRFLASEENPVEDVISSFTSWKGARGDYYARRAYALSLKYNPLDNYDSTETRTGSTETIHGETITRTMANSDTQTLANSDTRTLADSKTTTLNNTDTSTETYNDREHVSQREVSGFNSANLVPAETNTETDTGSEQNVTAHTGTITDTNSGTITDAHSGTITDAHSGTITDAHSGKDSMSDGYTLKRHGNIGVTTSSQMLSSDYDLLKRDLGITALYEWYDCYTMICDSIDL